MNYVQAGEISLNGIVFGTDLVGNRAVPVLYCSMLHSFIMYSLDKMAYIGNNKILLRIHGDLTCSVEIKPTLSGIKLYIYIHLGDLRAVAAYTQALLREYTPALDAARTQIFHIYCLITKYFAS